MDMFAFVLIIKAICGAIAGVIAQKKGRSEVGWFFAGFIFDILGIIIIAVLSDLNEEDNYRNHMERENRRLREQLRQEQIKSEGFRGHVSSRLDAHDSALSIDTRQTPDPRALPDCEDRQPFQSILPNNCSNKEDQAWFYEKEGKEHGPISGADMCSLIISGVLSRSCLVWKEGFKDWMPLMRVPELCMMLQEEGRSFLR
jgi:hypothetical protein